MAADPPPNEPDLFQPFPLPDDVPVPIQGVNGNILGQVAAIAVAFIVPSLLNTCFNSYY